MNSEITVGELKEILENHDDDERVILQLYSSDARVIVGRGTDYEDILHRYKSTVFYLRAI